MTEAPHDGAGELSFDGAATLLRPVEVSAQCLSGTFGRRAASGRVQRVDNARDGVRGTSGERLHPERQPAEAYASARKNHPIRPIVM